MRWFKTKTTTPAPNSPAHLLTLVRTMEDDLSGREIPTEVVRPDEPLVAFRSDTTIGAPFYTAPGTVEPEVRSTMKESPFLKAVEPAEPVSRVETPVFDPPLPAPPDTLPVAPLEETATAVAFNTKPQSTLPSLRSSIGSFSRVRRNIWELFQDRKIRIITLIAVTLLLIAIGAATYFWWYASSENSPNGRPDVRVESPAAPVIVTESAPTPVAEKKYQSEQPNILSFDIETVTPEQIKSTFLQVGQTIKQDNLPGAVEFLIRDQKYNPLAFSRFAYLARLNLPAELLSTLDEPFSLYLFTDNGRPRLVLLAYVKDELVFDAELRKNEKSLALALEPLFLDVTTAPKNNLTFSDGTYLERPVRYTNVDSTLGLSIDYAVRGKQWIIGTSKDSLRAVLDETGL